MNMLTKDIKLPPNDNDAEENALGALLIDGDLFDEITIQPSDFYFETNQFIFQAMIDLRKRGVGINQITVSQELNAVGKLEIIGGVARLSYLISICGSSLDLHWYADIIHRLSNYRQLISAADKIASIGYQADGDLGNSLEKADELLLSVRKHSGAMPVITPDEVADNAFARYSKLHNQESSVTTTTGLKDLDWYLGGGFYGGDYVIIAGRPGMGKTELCLTIASAASKVNNVLFCSAEMGVDSVVDRIVAGKLGLPLADIRRGGYSEKLFADISGEPIQYLKDMNIYYFRDMPMTTAKIMQAAMGMQLRFGLSMIIIDYLGILDDEYGNSGYERLGYISRKTKQLARVLDIPVIAVHQLNREVEHLTDKRPQLKDLRDSGKLEEDADVVLLLYRESYYTSKPTNNRTDIIIAKHRQGVANKEVGVYYDIKKHQYRDLIQER